MDYDDIYILTISSPFDINKSIFSIRASKNSLADKNWIVSYITHTNYFINIWSYYKITWSEAILKPRKATNYFLGTDHTDVA